MLVSPKTCQRRRSAQPRCRPEGSREPQDSAKSASISRHRWHAISREQFMHQSYPAQESILARRSISPMAIALAALVFVVACDDNDTLRLQGVSGGAGMGDAMADLGGGQWRGANGVARARPTAPRARAASWATRARAESQAVRARTESRATRVRTQAQARAASRAAQVRAASQAAQVLAASQAAQARAVSQVQPGPGQYPTAARAVHCSWWATTRTRPETSSFSGLPQSRQRLH